MHDNGSQLDLQIRRICLQIHLRRVVKGVALEVELGKMLPQVSRDIELLFRMTTANLVWERDHREVKSDGTPEIDQKPELPGMSEVVEELCQLGVVDRSLVLEVARKSSTLQQLRAGGDHAETKSETVCEGESESPGERNL